MFFVFLTHHAEVSIYAVTDQLTKVLMTKYLCSTDHVWWAQERCVFFAKNKDRAMKALQFQLQQNGFLDDWNTAPHNLTDLLSAPIKC